MRREVFTCLLLLSCSGEIGDLGQRREALTEAVTVCAAEPDDVLDEHIQWSVNYWWERGYSVEWLPGPNCMVQVRIAHHSGHEKRNCYDGNPSLDGWCNGETALYASSVITLRIEPWERFGEGRRAKTLTHELGHPLGIPHSNVMPMKTCEVAEWCPSAAEVERWWTEANSTGSDAGR
jgi:hypothetical protein